LSPDKRQLAFTLHQGDRAALMIVPTVGGEPQLVLYPEFGAPSELQWGPDGKYLYYKNEGLWRVPASGGQPERLD
jgi:dipeptidyl aminopeptidase/acylaminoacyl peptidase